MLPVKLAYLFKSLYTEPAVGANGSAYIFQFSSVIFAVKFNT